MTTNSGLPVFGRSRQTAFLGVVVVFLCGLALGNFIAGVASAAAETCSCQNQDRKAKCPDCTACKGGHEHAYGDGATGVCVRNTTICSGTDYVFPSLWRRCMDDNGCHRGSTFDGEKCVDVDECVAGTHDCNTVTPHANCQNIPGSWVCGCPDGYEFKRLYMTCHHIVTGCEYGWGYYNGACIPDPCMTGVPKCGANEECVPSDDFTMTTCQCAAGYTLSADSGACIEDHCVTVPCGAVGSYTSCVNTPTSRICTCESGYSLSFGECQQ